MICYNARVIVRSVVVAAALLAPAMVLAQPVPNPTLVIGTTYEPAVATTSSIFLLGTSDLIVTGTSSGALVTGSSGSMAPGMKPGVPKPPMSKHPYFFAAYGAVWMGLFAYVLWLATRIKALDRSR